MVNGIITMIFPIQLPISNYQLTNESNLQSDWN